MKSPPKPWPAVPLGTVIRQRKEFIRIDDMQTYKRPRVQLHAKGIIERDTVTGAEIKTKTQQVCRAGEFLVAEIDAKVGGFGVVPANLEGSLVSSHYFLFQIDETKLDRRFLDFYSRTPTFCDQVAAQGSTNYAAIRPGHVLGYTIPLPPLPDQHRIVACIEQLAAQIDEARQLRQEAAEETTALVRSELNELAGRARAKGVPFKTIGSFTVYDRYGPRFYDEPYSDDGVRIMRATDIDDTGNVDYDSMPRMSVSPEQLDELTLKPGDLAIVRSGSIGLAAVFDRPDVPCIPAAYLIQFRFDESVLPTYVRYCLQAPHAQDELAGRGTALKNVNATKIKGLTIPVPPLPDQRRIVDYLDGLAGQVTALTRLQSETAAELDALLPSVLDQAFHGQL